MSFLSRGGSYWILFYYLACILHFILYPVNVDLIPLCNFVVCEKGTFGMYCKGECHCADQNVCEPVTGTCQSGGCEPGWTGHTCQENGKSTLIVE